MVVVKEKLNEKTEDKIDNVRKNAIRQDSKVNLSLFNYCFLTYFYTVQEIKKYTSYAKGDLLDVGCGSSPFEKYYLNHVDNYLRHEHPDVAKENIKYDSLSELPKLPLKDNSIDTIICFSVLEHVNEPFETMKEFKRVLKGNGILIFSVPQYWHLHEEPHDYLRFTRHILNKKLTEFGFEIIILKEIGKSFAIVGQAFCNALVLLFDLNHVKNIFNLLSGQKTKNIGKSLAYAMYKSPLILLVTILIPVINLLFLTLDYLFGSPRDTIAYFVIARKP